MKKLSLILLALFLCVGISLSAARRNAPETREYKVLLKAERFASFRQGCELFWELVEKVAQDHGVKVKKADKTYPNRDICFLDTPGFLLNKRGFILRLRSESIAWGRKIRMGNDAEMTLKFRSSDLESTKIAPVKYAAEFTGELSFEEDIVVKATAPVSVFSVSSKVFRPDSVPVDLDALLKFYPEMNKAGFSGKERLKTVNGIFVNESRLRLGELKFSGYKAKTIFSAWYRRGTAQPFAAEFSFKIKLDDKNPAQRIRNLEKIDVFFTDLVKRGKLFVAFGQTKTGLIYKSRRK